MVNQTMPELGARCRDALWLALLLALRSKGGVEVGILGGDVIVGAHRLVGGVLRKSCPRRLQEVLPVTERRLPMALSADRGRSRISAGAS